MSIRRFSIYNGPIELTDKANRAVRIKLEYDTTLPVFAELYEVDPGNEHPCRISRGEIVFTIPRRSSKGRLGATRYFVDFYQFIAKEIAEPDLVPSAKFSLSNMNPPKKEEAVKKTSNMLSAVKNNKLSQMAIEKTRIRQEEYNTRRNEFIESKALKPNGLQGRRVLTCDDIGYTKGAGIIKYLQMMEEEYNQGNNSETENRLINEFYDCFAFSGTSSIIGLYLALGGKSIGAGSIEYLLKWWTHSFRFAFSLTPSQNAKAKVSRIFKGKEPNGLSEKNARRYLEELFVNPNNGEQYTLADINIEVYQPIMFEDLRSRVYTRGGTPESTLVDVAVNCGLDPRRFSVRQTEDVGSSIGAFRRSYDLPIAQNNPNGLSITSLGIPLRFQPPKKSTEEATVAQHGMIAKEASYLTEYHDTIKHMDNHSDKIKFHRIELREMDAISDYSVNRDNLRYAIACAGKATLRINGQKLLAQD